MRPLLSEPPRNEHSSRRILFSALLIAAMQLSTPASAIEDNPPIGQAESAATPVSVDVLLERMAGVAELYSDNALRFSCDEEITYTHFSSSGRVQDRRRYDLRYLYTYEQGSESPTDAEGARRGSLADYRTIRDENAGDGTYREIQLEELALPNYLKRAYSWAFLFEESRQARYQYEILGEENMHGVDALILGFDPIPPYVKTVNDWFGKAWIDKESFQLLRVEANSSDALTDNGEEEGEEEEQDVYRAQTFTVTRITTDFAVEKNGMRFPSHAILTASVSQRLAEAANLLAAITGDMEEYDGEVRTVFRVDQTYNDYRFFNVRSETEIRDKVMGIRRS
jgi:hypothetical protein